MLFEIGQVIRLDFLRLLKELVEIAKAERLPGPAVVRKDANVAFRTWGGRREKEGGREV